MVPSFLLLKPTSRPRMRRQNLKSGVCFLNKATLFCDSVGHAFGDALLGSWRVGRSNCSLFLGSFANSRGSSDPVIVVKGYDASLMDPSWFDDHGSAYSFAGQAQQVA
ncbi:hypothetical protein DKX38_004798 [Salix brachista]|uniref:Uncharacterized protein n=1 Tax=Salix brachista TaxID=2182728 RepID=A0A5N5NB46_9ROSI|nr:hypothetical protein DKX38_004798 [Salix brachista]